VPLPRIATGQLHDQQAREHEERRDEGEGRAAERPGGPGHGMLQHGERDDEEDEREESAGLSHGEVTAERASPAGDEQTGGH
jgi:hypothetical protein